MIGEYINILSAILTLVAAIYFVVVANRCNEKLRKSFLFLAVGIFIALAVHSSIEALEAFGLINPLLLLQIMPILVLTGSILLIIGTYYLYDVVTKTEHLENEN